MASIKEIEQSGYRLPASWKEGDEPKQGAAPAENKAEDDLGAMTKAELEALAEERGVEVKGTGADGAVLKADLVKALG